MVLLLSETGSLLLETRFSRATNLDAGRLGRERADRGGSGYQFGYAAIPGGVAKADTHFFLRSLRLKGPGFESCHGLCTMLGAALR